MRSAAVFGSGLLITWFGILRHRAMTMVRMDITLRTVRVVVRQAVRLGATLPQRVAAGEVVSIGASDVGGISQTLTVTGPGVGAVIAYGVVTAKQADCPSQELPLARASRRWLTSSTWTVWVLSSMVYRTRPAPSAPVALDRLTQRSTHAMWAVGQWPYRNSTHAMATASGRCW
jgi:hypothetical protein